MTDLIGADMNKRTCNVTKCNQESASLGMCNLHYQRSIHGRPLIQEPKVALERCTVDGCTKPPRSKYATMCPMHYHRVYRYGSLTPVHAPKFEDLTGRRFAILTAVSRQPDGRWLCRCDCGRTNIYNVGNLNNGSALTCGDKATHYRTAETYGAAHGRVRADRGSASEYSCVDCGDDALHWSYNHSDPDEIRDWTMKGAPWFSMYPRYYEPRCVPCHKRMDLQVAKDRGIMHR